MKKYAIVLLLLSIFITTNSLANSKVTGVYSSLSLNEESGDLSGIEISIMYTSKGYYLLFQAAEGVPFIPVLMPINIKNNSFQVQLPDGPNYGGAILKGEILDGGINAEFLNGPLSPKGEKKFFLKRGKSYWQ